MPSAPLMVFDPQGSASVLSHNVPDSTSYPMAQIISMVYPEELFKSDVLKIPKPAEMSIDDIEKSLRNLLETGVMDPRLQGRIGGIPILQDMASKGSKAKIIKSPLNLTGEHLTFRAAPMAAVSAGAAAAATVANSGTRPTDTAARPGSVARPADAVRDTVPAATPADSNTELKKLAALLHASRRVVFAKNMSGRFIVKTTAKPIPVKPSICLIETYRISTYLGAYGAGRTVKTFSLLPGERTKISVKTYLRSSQSREESSSILDSVSEETVDELEQAMESENSSTASESTNTEYYADASATGTSKILGQGGEFTVSGGVSGGTNATREEQTKNAKSALSKHAAKASSKRDIQVDTSYKTSTETGEETSIEREIENINVGRTLNFVFRQMNQEFFTLFHLTDIRLAYFNGYSESKIEVPLHQMESLLDQVAADNAAKEKIREDIELALTSIRDHRGAVAKGFCELAEYDEGNGRKSAYWRINRDHLSEFRNPATGQTFSIPGVILGVSNNVMRTEGLIVEAILGQGQALDDYNTRLQEAKVKSQLAAVEAAELRNRKEELALKLVADNNAPAADVFSKVFPVEHPAETKTPQ